MPHLVNIFKTSILHESNAFSVKQSITYQEFFHIWCPGFLCFSCVSSFLRISALSDSQSNFLLNGNFVVAMFKREITFKGTVIEYSGSDTKEERINCTERIEEELILQVKGFSSLL